MGLKFHEMIHDLHIRQNRELDQLAVKYGTDKQVSGNFYTPHYEAYFKNVRSKHLKVLELGIGAGGPFLKALEEYFPNASIFGAEIYGPFCEAYKGRGTILQGNLGEREFVDHIASHGPFDIIIEDANHSMQQQQELFLALFPAVCNNGVYIIEDIGTSYMKSFGGRLRDGYNTIDKSKDLVDYVNLDFFRQTPWFHQRIEGPYSQESTDLYAHPFEKSIYAIHFYRGLILVFKQDNCNDNQT